jgi:choline kinase
MSEHPETQVVFLVAGRGRRMGALSDLMPKPLIPITGPLGALEINLKSLSALRGGVSVILVTGYRAGEFVRLSEQSDFSISLVNNDLWEDFGPVRSMILGLGQCRPGANVVLANGDTIFDAELLRSAVKGSFPRDVTLFGSRVDQSERDDVIIAGENGRVLEARKLPQVTDNAVISAGLVRLSSDEARLRLKGHLEQLFEQEKRAKKPAIWHSVFEQMHLSGASAGFEVVASEHWHEFDTAVNIESFQSKARV